MTGGGADAAMPGIAHGGTRGSRRLPYHSPYHLTVRFGWHGWTRGDALHAQTDALSVLAREWGSRGRWFESSRPDQQSEHEMAPGPMPERALRFLPDHRDDVLADVDGSALGSQLDCPVGNDLALLFGHGGNELIVEETDGETR